MPSALYKDDALQRTVLNLVDRQAHHGITVAELRERLSEHHHGTLSGVLSVLHRDFRIARLTEKREGCKVYVHPDYLDNRRAEPQGRDTMSVEERTYAESLLSFLDYWMQVDSDGARFATDKTKAERNHRLFLAQLKDMHKNRP